MTISTTPATDTPQHTDSLLTPFDVLDAYCALQNAAAADCTALNARDRQALAYLTYTPEPRGITRMLLSKLANETASLPLPNVLAVHLLELTASLPPVSEADQNAWLAAHDVETPCVTAQIIAAVAEQAAANVNNAAAHLALTAALQTVIRIAHPDMPLDDVPMEASGRIAAALLDHAGEGILPAQQPDPLATVAAYADEHSMDVSGTALRSSLVAALLTRDHRIPALDAVRLTRRGFDQRVKAAGRDANELIKQAGRDRLAAEQDEAVAVAL